MSEFHSRDGFFFRRTQQGVEIFLGLLIGAGIGYLVCDAAGPLIRRWIYRKRH